MIKFSLLFELINHLTRLTEPFTPLINKTMQVLELVPKCSGFQKGGGEAATTTAKQGKKRGRKTKSSSGESDVHVSIPLLALQVSSMSKEQLS